MEFQTRRRPARITARARSLRVGGNVAEAIVWNELKDRKPGGKKFVRQLPIGPYFADFACREAKLVVELDGSQHEGRGYDRVRDEFMRQRGFSVLRFWSGDVRKELANICETILAAIDGRLAQDVVATDLRFVFAERVASRS